MKIVRFSALGCALLMLSVVLAGCFENPPITYDGPAIAEFAPNRTAAGGYSRAITLAPDATSDVQSTVTVQMVGPHVNSPTTVNYRVHDASTAVAGTHFAYAPEGSVTIPAGESSATIQVTVLAAGTPQTAPGAPAAAPRTLILELTGGDIEPSENYRTFQFTISRAPTPEV